MKVIYIHGWGSSGKSESARAIKNFVPGMLTPTYDPLRPSKSLEQLDKLIGDEEAVLVGSSLGGWFANQLSNRKENVRVLLYNPSTQPHKSLEKYGVSSEIREEYKALSMKHRKGSVKTVILSEDDEVIDYRIAEKFFEKTAEIVYNTGGHRIGSNVPEVLREIAKLTKK